MIQKSYKARIFRPQRYVKNTDLGEFSESRKDDIKIGSIEVNTRFHEPKA